MLKLPGRGKEVKKPVRLFSSYKNLFHSIRSSVAIRKDIKTEVSSDMKIDNRLVSSIKLSGVEKGFGKNVVLKNLNFEIPRGKIFGIIGVSGSGKTTLLRLIVGYYRPNKGQVIFNDKEVWRQNIALAKHFGFASQENAFYDNLTAAENVRFFGNLYGLMGGYLYSRVENALMVVGLNEYKDILAKNLSGGMKRRLDVACAIVNEPSILILDEPTEDLDPILRKEILNLIKKINVMGTTVIFTTHLLDEAEFLCDHVAILCNQTVLTIGAPDELKKRYKRGEEIHILLEDKKRYGHYLKSIGDGKTRIVNDRLVVYVPENKRATKVLRKILSNIEKNRDKVIYVDIRKPTLSEIFTHLIENAEENKKK